jgi:arsenite methyltransferase
MLHDTRFAPHFDFIGNFDRHYGVFSGCGTDMPFDSAALGGGAAAACC